MEYVYKDELKAIRRAASSRVSEAEAELVANGMAPDKAKTSAHESVAEWVKTAEADLAKRYEREIMNPEEALSLGSVSQIVMPSDLRSVIGQHLMFCLRHYEPGPMGGIQREFH